MNLFWISHRAQKKKKRVVGGGGAGAREDPECTVQFSFRHDPKKCICTNL